jgi:hypothetical protein
VSDTPQYLELHSSLAEELRHSDGFIWQLAIAIIAIEEGTVALSPAGGFQSFVGKGALAAGSLLAVCLSFMLLRHAGDRRSVVRRMRTVEDELRKEYPKVFTETAGSPQWFAAMLLAWILLGESVVGFGLLLWQLYT